MEKNQPHCKSRLNFIHSLTYAYHPVPAGRAVIFGAVSVRGFRQSYS
jgi:hypothetical protein